MTHLYIETIERVRDHSKELWAELARILGFEFKIERRHNDVIIQMLQAIIARPDCDPRAKELLRWISKNDRTVSDLTRKIADACDD